jgi:ABC-type branched-subunit amino acid transport system ATPase component
MVAHRAYVLEKGHVVAENTGAALLGSDLIRKTYLGL